MPYPSALDSFDTVMQGSTLIATDDHANNHRTVGSALGAVEVVLGTTQGTSTLMNFKAGDFATREDSGGTFKFAHMGTFNNSVFGTPSITAGTIAGQVQNNGTVANGLYGTATWQGGTIIKPVVNASVPNMSIYSPSAGGTATLDCGTANFFTVNLPAGNITVATTNDTLNQPFLVRCVEDSTGTRVITWFSGIRWPGNSTPATSGGTKIDTFGFIKMGVGMYDGYIVGQNL